jgi:tetratricopeptide (TPR) repeat protein
MKSPRSDSTELIELQMKECWEAFYIGDTERAKIQYSQAKLRSTEVPYENFSLACWNFGRFEFEMAQYPEALKSYQVGLSMVDDDEVKVNILLGLGELHCKLKEFDDSESYFIDAIDLARTLSNYLLKAKVLNDHATLKYWKFQYREAISYSSEGLQILKSLQSFVCLEMSACLNNKGRSQRELGNIDEANESLDEALRIRRLCLHPDHPDLAVSFINLGYLHYLNEDYSDYTKSLLHESLRIRKNALDINHPDIAKSQFCLGIFYFAWERNACGVEIYLLRAYWISEKHYPNCPYKALIRYYLAKYSLKSGELKKARFYFIKCSQILEKHDLIMPQLKDTYGCLESINQQLGRSEEADEYLAKRRALPERPSQIAVPCYERLNR